MKRQCSSTTVRNIEPVTIIHRRIVVFWGVDVKKKMLCVEMYIMITNDDVGRYGAFDDAE
jgi:hypothetical protein